MALCSQARPELDLPKISVPGKTKHEVPGGAGKVEHDAGCRMYAAYAAVGTGRVEPPFALRVARPTL